MNNAYDSVRRLGWSLLLALAAVAIAAALASYMQARYKSAERIYSNVRAQRQLARNQYLQSALDEQHIRATIARFSTLQEQGVIGIEHRLDWLEQIQHARANQNLVDFDYVMTPQRTLDLVDAQNLYRLKASKLDIKATLRHEGELFRLIDGLRATSSAVVAPIRCSLQRSDDPASSSMLQAQCELEWITFDHAAPIAPVAAQSQATH